MIAQAASDPMSWGSVALLAPAMMIAGLALMRIGRRATQGTLGRNAIAGIRTRATMRSDAAWEAGHRAGGGLMIPAGALFVVAGLALLTRPSNSVGTTITMGVTVGVLVVAVVSTRRANRAARAVD